MVTVRQVIGIQPCHTGWPIFLDTLWFVPFPSLYWLYLAIMLLGYAMLTQVVKTWFIRRFGE